MGYHCHYSSLIYIIDRWNVKILMITLGQAEVDSQRNLATDMATNKVLMEFVQQFVSEK